jgi:hypothetical protein
MLYSGEKNCTLHDKKKKILTRIFFSATLGIRMFFIESKKMTEKKISIGKKGYGCK